MGWGDDNFTRAFSGDSGWIGQQKEKRKKYKRKMLRLAGQERDVGRLYGEDILSEHRKGMEAELGGYDAALKRGSSALRTAKRQGFDQATQAAGSLASRYGGGYGMTTAYDDAIAGLSSQTTRNLANIDASFAGMLGGLEIGRGGAEAAGRGRIAGGLAGRAGVETQYLDRLRTLYQDPNAYQQGLGSMDLLSLGAETAGTVIGSIYGTRSIGQGVQAGRSAMSAGGGQPGGGQPYPQGAYYGGSPHYSSPYGYGDYGGEYTYPASAGGYG